MRWCGQWEQQKVLYILNRNMCTSLQNIVTFNDRYSLQQDIQGLFRPKDYPKFELHQFYSNELHQKHEQFRFFVDILEEWNRKIEANQSQNHFDTILEKNVFIYNSLRNTIMQPHCTSNLILNHLYHWFNTTRNRNIRVVEKRQKQLTQQDEDWIVRNTFKSNLPSEIDNYHRRIVCRFKEGREKPIQESDLRKGYTLDNIGRKVKTQAWTGPEMDRNVQNRRIAKIQNELVRFQKEQEELKSVQMRWKAKKARQNEKNTKDLYRACFSTGKTYFPKKKKTMKENNWSSSTLAFRQLKTNAGQRTRKHAKEMTRLSASEKSQDQNTARLRSEAESDAFKEFDACEIRLSGITGLRLMDNPLQSKLKKKKRVK